MSTTAPAWLRREVMHGLKAMISIGPENTPALEMVTKVADVWLIAIQRGGVGISIEAVDAPRIREGFERLIPTLVKWPLPKHLLDQIPGRPERLRLPAPPPTDEEIAEGLRQFRTIAAHVGGINVDLPFPSKEDVEARRQILKAQARMIQAQEV